MSQDTAQPVTVITRIRQTLVGDGATGLQLAELGAAYERAHKALAEVLHLCERARSVRGPALYISPDVIEDRIMAALQDGRNAS